MHHAMWAARYAVACLRRSGWLAAGREDERRWLEHTHCACATQLAARSILRKAICTGGWQQKRASWVKALLVLLDALMLQDGDAATARAFQAPELAPG